MNKTTTQMPEERTRRVNQRQIDEVLASCPLCLRGGPKERVAEHLAVDHPRPETPSLFVGDMPPDLKAVLKQKQAETGWSLGHLVEYALRSTWGR